MLQLKTIIYQIYNNINTSDYKQRKVDCIYIGTLSILPPCSNNTSSPPGCWKERKENVNFDKTGINRYQNGQIPIHKCVMWKSNLQKLHIYLLWECYLQVSCISILHTVEMTLSCNAQCVMAMLSATVSVSNLSTQVTNFTMLTCRCWLYYPWL